MGGRRDAQRDVAVGLVLGVDDDVDDETVGIDADGVADIDQLAVEGDADVDVALQFGAVDETVVVGVFDDGHGRRGAAVGRRGVRLGRGQVAVLALGEGVTVAGAEAVGGVTAADTLDDALELHEVVAAFAGGAAFTGGRGLLVEQVVERPVGGERRR